MYVFWEQELFYSDGTYAFWLKSETFSTIRDSRLVNVPDTAPCCAASPSLNCRLLKIYLAP